ncbi:L-aspartate oxidase [Bacillus solitudinis]|uniref:L-aspartate oxidase n=1 Tax=Bacillus solitudinis TaxID=2014074 RepID=UPI000C24A2A9|nr:L-aspartate oxidase [Bacillus solitudinis]
MASKGADVLIIGSGIAGLMAAHLLADKKNVILITKSKVEVSNSSWAQGGIAAAIGPDDHWKYHFKDTLLAGQDHHVQDHVAMLVQRAPDLIKAMKELGVPFDTTSEGEFSLGMEGAHSRRRIVHAHGDQTGRAFTDTLINKLQGRVTFVEETMALELLKQNNKVIGVRTNKGKFLANATILATGGAGQLFKRTSNVREATGDGFALAYRAGAMLADMEFVQFHPTILFTKNKAMGLISEAVRGEGAVLVDNYGKKIMEDHPQKDLASRDIVSRAIHHAYLEGREVYLDCRMIRDFPTRFPGISRICEKASIDLDERMLPVAPGAHFMSGGVWTDQCGRSSVEQLYAIGEVACTGVHGANRLASNSLLEGLVFAEAVSKDLLTQESSPVFEVIETSKVVGHIQLPSKESLQERMTEWVGIERDASSLMKMKQWLQPYLSFVKKSVFQDKEHVEMANMLLVASIMTDAAFTRTESRGGHFRSDYPVANDDNWLKKYITTSLDNKANSKNVVLGAQS